MAAATAWRAGIVRVSHELEIPKCVLRPSAPETVQGRARSRKAVLLGFSLLLRSLPAQRCVSQIRAASCAAAETQRLRGRIASRHTSTETDAVLRHPDGSRGFGRGRGSAGGRPRGAAARSKRCLRPAGKLIRGALRRHTRQRTRASENNCRGRTEREPLKNRRPADPRGRASKCYSLRQPTRALRRAQKGATTRADDQKQQKQNGARRARTAAPTAAAAPVTHRGRGRRTHVPLLF